MLLKDLIEKNKITEDLLKNVNNKILHNKVRGISSNSKEIKKGYIFVAIKGKNFDGAEYIAEAEKLGAFLIIAEESCNKKVFSIKKGTARQIYTLLLSSFYIKQPKQIIGVTGTNGKTSTVEFCRQLWALAGWKAASMGTLGTKTETAINKSVYKNKEENLTTFEPSDLYKKLNFLVEEKISHLALEASSHGIDQYRLDGVNFSGAVFTNLSHDHLDYHGNTANYFSTKKRLFTKVLKNNSAISINIDDIYGKKLYEELKDDNHFIITFGQCSKADIKIKSVVQNKQSIDLILEFKKQNFQTTIGMIGKFQVYNVVASASICIALGMDSNLIFKSLGYLKPAPGRMEVLSETKNKALVIIDYAHTPAALKSALKSIQEIIGRKRIITLFGCGGDRDKNKRKIMGEIANEYSDIVIVTDDNPRNEIPSNIRSEILSGCPSATEIPNRDKAIKYAVSLLKKNDLLLIAGKGHETFQAVGIETLPFDDYTVAKEAIKNIEKSGIIN